MLDHFTFPPAELKAPISPHPRQHSLFSAVFFFLAAIPAGVRRDVTVAWTCSSTYPPKRCDSSLYPVGQGASVVSSSFVLGMFLTSLPSSVTADTPHHRRGSHRAWARLCSVVCLSVLGQRCLTSLLSLPWHFPRDSSHDVACSPVRP